VAVTPVSVTLQNELAYYQAHKQELLASHRGQFALIHGNELLGIFPRFEEAFEAGVGKLGNRPFLIQPIMDEDTEVQFPALAVGMINARL
jgi:hypothetical protein